MAQLTEFEQWMEKNKEKFTTYTNDEIVMLAATCGFGYEEILKVLERRGQ